MNRKTISHWDKRYQDSPKEASPCSLLNEYGYLLPKEGLVLDLACGLAGNAFYMAERGLQAHAVDNSRVAIDHVNEKAQNIETIVKGIVRDIETKGLMDYQYDVIVVSYFLNRSLIPTIIQHLKPDGLLFYQTWTKEKVVEIGPKNPDYLLDKGELLSFCKGLNILHYHEENSVGDIQKGFRNQAKIIAQQLSNLAK